MKLAHCTYFFCPTYASKLRGQSYWEMLGRVLVGKWRLRAPLRWLKLNFSNLQQPHVYINPSGIQTPPNCRHTLLVLCMPAMDPIPEVVDSYKEHGGRLVVDIFADVLGLVHPDDRSPSAKAAGDTVPEENWQWWAGETPQRVLRYCLAEADVVTTSFAEYVPGLRELTGYRVPVIHVPDLRDEVAGSLLAFKVKMDQVLNEVRYDR